MSDCTLFACFNVKLCYNQLVYYKLLVYFHIVSSSCLREASLSLIKGCFDSLCLQNILLFQDLQDILQIGVTPVKQAMLIHKVLFAQPFFKRKSVVSPNKLIYRNQFHQLSFSNSCSKKLECFTHRKNYFQWKNGLTFRNCQRSKRLMKWKPGRWMSRVKTGSRSRPSCCRRGSERCREVVRRPETGRTHKGSDLQESFQVEGRPVMTAGSLHCWH